MRDFERSSPVGICETDLPAPESEQSRCGTDVECVAAEALVVDFGQAIEMPV